jgi:hypothetical protein
MEGAEVSYSNEERVSMEYHLILLDISQYQKSYPRCSGPPPFGGKVLRAFLYPLEMAYHKIAR